MKGDVSINSLADEWNVSAQEAIKKLVDEGITTYCVLPADLTDTHSGEFEGQIKAECDVDHMDIARLINDESVEINIIELLQRNDKADFMLCRIDLEEGRYTYSNLPEPETIRLTTKIIFVAQENIGENQGSPDVSRNTELQEAANTLAKQWQGNHRQFSKRKIAIELAKSDEWKDMTASTIERILRKQWEAP